MDEEVLRARERARDLAYALGYDAKQKAYVNDRHYSLDPQRLQELLNTWKGRRGVLDFGELGFVEIGNLRALLCRRARTFTELLVFVEEGKYVNTLTVLWETKKSRGRLRWFLQRAGDVKHEKGKDDKNGNPTRLYVHAPIEDDVVPVPLELNLMRVRATEDDDADREVRSPPAESA